VSEILVANLLAGISVHYGSQQDVTASFESRNIDIRTGRCCPSAPRPPVSPPPPSDPSHPPPSSTPKLPSNPAVRAFPYLVPLTQTANTEETPNPIDLLTKIGRNAEKRLSSQADSWEKLSEVWRRGGEAMEAAGLGPRDRRWVHFSVFVLDADLSRYIVCLIRGWGFPLLMRMT